MDFSDSGSIVSVGNRAIKYSTGVLAGLLSAATLSFFSALIMTIDSVPDGAVSLFAYAVAAVSACVCGFIGVLRLKKSGLVNGVILGVALFGIRMILYMILSFSDITLAETILKLAVDVVFSAVGGIIAVNIRR